MISFRSAALIAASTALVGLALSQAKSQTADSQAPKTPSEMAKAIAGTISAFAPPNARMTIAATSHDNIVEMKTVLNDAAAFAHLKSNADQVRIGKTSYYCNESHIAYLKQGVVMHEVFAALNSLDQFDFSVDISSCERLPEAKLADAKTVTELASTVAKAENEASDKASNPAFHFNGASAHEGVVDERYLITDASARSSLQANRGNITGTFTGYFCSKYRDVIFQGLVFHQVFVLEDGSPVIDFTIDKSKC